MTELGAVILLSYLLGAIPTGLIVGRVAGGLDIRTQGSGNAGATNVYRIFGLKLYLLTLSVDIFKGYSSVVFIAPFGVGVFGLGGTGMLCGVAAVIGHIWTLFARFKGGKGVATAGGMLLGIAPLPVLGAILVYAAITLTTKYVSLGSIMAAVTAPLIMTVEKLWFDGSEPWELIGLTAALALLIIITHRANIGRLLRGEENKTDFLRK